MMHANLSPEWGLPFAGLLLSIAIAPLVAPRFWYRQYGLVVAIWTAAFVVPFTVQFGFLEMVHGVAHALLAEYIPFVAILFALFTVTGGIRLRGTLAGTPAVNTALLALGTVLASIMGTTGASMLLVRPLLAANEQRRYRVHVVVFFILLVGNVGGALTPLGDPPLFIGFLKGVDFFWTTRELALPTIILSVALLLLSYTVDQILYRRERRKASSSEGSAIAIEGWGNLLLLVAINAAVLLSGLWHPPISFHLLGTRFDLQGVVRDALMIAIALASIAWTPKHIRERNVFHWAPIVEVSKIFAGIFITMIPVIAILQAGSAGALSRLVIAVSDEAGRPRDAMYFWITGTLSAFLDNAPTYLVFFNLAGGDAAALMGPLRPTLRAISMAAVYFGALTYIGNAPNFMIRAIAEDRGVTMPSFFGYFAYAALIMLPMLALLSLLAL